MSSKANARCSQHGCNNLIAPVTTGYSEDVHPGLPPWSLSHAPQLVGLNLLANGSTMALKVRTRTPLIESAKRATTLRSLHLVCSS